MTTVCQVDVDDDDDDDDADAFFRHFEAPKDWAQKKLFTELNHHQALPKTKLFTELLGPQNDYLLNLTAT